MNSYQCLNSSGLYATNSDIQKDELSVSTCSNFHMSYSVSIQHEWQWMGFKNAVWDLPKCKHGGIMSITFVEDGGELC